METSVQITFNDGRPSTTLVWTFPSTLTPEENLEELEEFMNEPLVHSEAHENAQEHHSDQGVRKMAGPKLALPKVLAPAIVALGLLVIAIPLLSGLDGVGFEVELSETNASRDPDFGAVQPAQIATSAQSLLVLGFEEDAQKLLISDDGDAWTPINAPEPDALIENIGSTEEGFVAFGTVDGVPVVWESLDALEWSRFVLDDEAFAGGTISGVTPTDSGFLAFGSVRNEAAVWTSPNAQDWSLFVLDDEAFAGGTISGVTPTDSGFLAFGSVRNEAAVWTSPNAQDWSLFVLDDEAFAGGTISGVTPTDSGFLAFGSVRNEAAVWTSSNALDWQRNSLDGQGFMGSSLADAIESNGELTVIGVSRDLGSLWQGETLSNR